MTDEQQKSEESGNDWEEDDEGEDDWDPYGDEVDEKEAWIKEAEAKANLEKNLKKVTIKFKPSNFVEGKIARIFGDFTDWVPENMRIPTEADIKENPSRKGEFYISFRVATGFRYRYWFEYLDEKIVDKSEENKSGIRSGNNAMETNFVDV